MTNEQLSIFLDALAERLRREISECESRLPPEAFETVKGFLGNSYQEAPALLGLKVAVSELEATAKSLLPQLKMPNEITGPG